MPSDPDRVAILPLGTLTLLLLFTVTAWTLFGGAAHAQGWTPYRPNGDSTLYPDSVRGWSYQPEVSTTYTKFQGPDGQIKHCMTFQLRDSGAIHTTCQ